MIHELTDAEICFSIYLKYTGYEDSQDERTKRLMWLAWNAGYAAGGSVCCSAIHEPGPGLASRAERDARELALQ